MRFSAVFFVLLISLGAWCQPVDTKKHTVQPGETKYGISRQYGISIETLEKYNPDVKNGLKAGMILLLPSADESKPEIKDEQVPADAKHIMHRVKAGETLYSLSRQYNVSIAEVQKLNPEVTSSGLKEGMVLLFPRVKASVETTEEPDTNFFWHEVKAGETAWMISRNYELTLDSLYMLNPELREGLRIGQMVKLPLNRKPRPKDDLATDVKMQERPRVDGEKLADTTDGYILYPVKTGDTFYNLKQRFLTERDELIKLNPELSEGLKVDKYILIPIKQEKLPDNFFDKIFNNTEIVGPGGNPSLEQYRTRDSLNQKEGKPADGPLTQIFEDSLVVEIDKLYRVAVLLPFYANEDSTRFENGVNPQSSVALDFYNAFMLAADTLTKQGMHLQLKVYDTRNDASKVRRIIMELKSEKPDLVIGPLFKNHAEKVAESLAEDGIMVVSPLSRTVETAGHPNLIKCIPGDDARIAEYAYAINRYYPNANLIFLDYPQNGIGQSVEIDQLVARINPTLGGRVISRHEVIAKKGNLGLDSIMDMALVKNMQNLVISLTEDKVFLSTLVGELRSGSHHDSTRVKLMTSSRVMDINTLDINYLNELEVTMPNNDFVDFRDPATVHFINTYRASYLEDPSKYAFQGYDVGMFFLSKLWYTGPYFERSIQLEQRMISTGFNIRPAQLGGYQNQYMLLTRIRNYELVMLPREQESKD